MSKLYRDSLYNTPFKWPNINIKNTEKIYMHHQENVKKTIYMLNSKRRHVNNVQKQEKEKVYIGISQF